MLQKFLCINLAKYISFLQYYTFKSLRLLCKVSINTWQTTIPSYYFNPVSLFTWLLLGHPVPWRIIHSSPKAALHRSGLPHYCTKFPQQIPWHGPRLTPDWGEMTAPGWMLTQHQCLMPRPIWQRPCQQDSKMAVQMARMALSYPKSKVWDILCLLQSARHCFWSISHGFTKFSS